MVDEILAPYLKDLREAYKVVRSSATDPRIKLRDLVAASLQVVEAHPHATEIYQSDVNYLSQSEGFGYLTAAAGEAREAWLAGIGAGGARGVVRARTQAGTADRVGRAPAW